MAQIDETEIDLNFDAFCAMLPELLQRYPGKFALLKNKALVDIYDTSLNAVVAGLQKFGEGQYSVQEVSQQSDNLGFYSYAGGAGQA